MKTSQFFTDEKRNKTEIWHETIDGRVSFWKKINGTSFLITERQYLNLIKKYDLINTLN